jgi:hypothetical protein
MRNDLSNDISDVPDARFIDGLEVVASQHRRLTDQAVANNRRYLAADIRDGSPVAIPTSGATRSSRGQPEMTAAEAREHLII